VYPALAVARSLRALPDAPELAWLGGHRGLEGRVIPATGIPFRRLVLRSLRSVDANLHVVLDPLRLVGSIPQALGVLATWRPDAIFTTGGFVAIPPLLAAAALRVPAVLWEGNARPGRAVRMTSRLVRAEAVSFRDAGERLGGTWYLTGTPIRPLSAVTPDAARARLGVPEGKPVVLVFGGSQEVRRFNDAVREALPEIATRVALVHVTGHSAIEEFRGMRDTLADAARASYLPFAFLGEAGDGPAMTDALPAADIVVGRAGSSTIAEVAAAGKPMVVVPYPHAAGHQTENTRVVTESGAGIVIEDEAFDGAALLRVADLLGDPERLRAMATGARTLARPAAADAVARLVMAVARREPLPDRGTIERLAVGAG